MSLADNSKFLKSILPFDRLPERALTKIAEALDVVYFDKEAVVPIDKDNNAYIFIVMKGRVAECSTEDSDEGKHCALYGANSQFGATTLLDSDMCFEYQTIEESILYRLPFAVFTKVISKYPEFEAFYFQDITQKLRDFHEQLQVESSSEAMMDSVSIAPLHELIEISENTSIQKCVELMEQHKSDACLVKSDTVYGVVTASDLLRGLAIHGFDLQSSVADLTSYPVVSIDEQDFLFNALLKMTRFGIDRLMVRNGNGFVGVLHQKELMSLFANQSGLVMLTLERAETFDDLKKVTQQIDDLISGLANKGVKTHYIAKLVNELHRKLQAKLWQILDVENEFTDTSFIVMGSEGRAEQVVRTDQDNAVIFAESVNPETLQTFCQKYTKKLIELGFPPCPGNIMVSNPVWRLNETAFVQQIKEWFEKPSLENFMNIAILFDAQVVNGDPERLNLVKQALNNQVAKRQMFLPHFARSVLQFETPIGLFGRLITQKDDGHSIDLKKGGIFPIVHGVRCLALEKGIEKTNTHWRIRELINRNVFTESFGVELGETLNFLNTLRLQSMLDKKSLGESINNAIATDKLNDFQQDLLKDAFSVVHKFKKFIEQHFKMEGMF